MRLRGKDCTRHVTLWGLSAAIALGGCARGATSTMVSRTSDGEEQGAGGAPATTVSKTSGGDDRPGAPATVSKAGDGDDHGGADRDRMVALHMDTYFWMALEARDALIAGSLNLAKSRMHRLSEQEYRTLVPAGWLPDMQQMVNEAKRVADAQDLREAADAMAGVAVACGTCHGKLHAGPLPNMTALSEPDKGSEDLPARMLRHQWAADKLWSGLTRPSDADWRAGAEALVDAPPEPPKSGGGAVVTKAMQSAIEGVRQVGRDALKSAAPEDRARIYARLLQSCSGCHDAR